MSSCVQGLTISICDLSGGHLHSSQSVAMIFCEAQWGIRAERFLKRVRHVSSFMPSRRTNFRKRTTPSEVSANATTNSCGLFAISFYSNAIQKNKHSRRSTFARCCFVSLFWKRLMVVLKTADGLCLSCNYWPRFCQLNVVQTYHIIGQQRDFGSNNTYFPIFFPNSQKLKFNTISRWSISSSQ